MGIEMTGAPNVNVVAFPGDPGHEGGSKNMHGLKGSCSGSVVAPVRGPFTNTGSAVGSPSDTSGDIAGWNNTSLADTGGAHNHTSDDARTKST